MEDSSREENSFWDRDYYSAYVTIRWGDGIEKKTFEVR